MGYCDIRLYSDAGGQVRVCSRCVFMRGCVRRYVFARKIFFVDMRCVLVVCLVRGLLYESPRRKPGGQFAAGFTLENNVSSIIVLR